MIAATKIGDKKGWQKNLNQNLKDKFKNFQQNKSYKPKRSKQFKTAIKQGVSESCNTTNERDDSKVNQADCTQDIKNNSIEIKWRMPNGCQLGPEKGI